MLPRAVQESAVSPFKFWFHDSLQDGVHFHNELYYRLKQMPSSSRSNLYQLGCKLMQHGADIFLTVDAESCSLWANLRNQKLAVNTLADKVVLPSVDMLLR